MEEQNPNPQSPEERHQLRDGGRGQREDGTRRTSTLPGQLPAPHTSSSSRPQLQQRQPRGTQSRSMPRMSAPCSTQGQSLPQSLPRLTSPRSSRGTGRADEGPRGQGSQGRRARPGGSSQPAILASRVAARGQHRPVRSCWACSSRVGLELASTRKPSPGPQREASHCVEQETQTETWAQEADSAAQYAEQGTQTDTVTEEEKNSAAPLMADQETETPTQEENSASPQTTDRGTQTKAHRSAPSTGIDALARQQQLSLFRRASWCSCPAGQPGTAPHAASALWDPRDSHCSKRPQRPERGTPEKWGWMALPPYCWPWLIEMSQF
ncbi:uncharacterized protein LOC116450960 [Corvus moneduloides]|uniref:uncharacterized protein LOC116450960 n=1 Tax=Corvus moneduloides TaxID=1196302 RepID=UPI0013647172|nr:uncharacterized protein LOC116450960 [Corvus moneduloides]